MALAALLLLSGSVYANQVDRNGDGTYNNKDVQTWQEAYQWASLDYPGWQPPRDDNTYEELVNRIRDEVPQESETKPLTQDELKKIDEGLAKLEKLEADMEHADEYIGSLQEELKAAYTQIQDQNDQIFNLRQALKAEREASQLDQQRLGMLNKSLLDSQELNGKLIDQLNKKTSPFKAFVGGMGFMGSMLAIIHAIW